LTKFGEGFFGEVAGMLMEVTASLLGSKCVGLKSWEVLEFLISKL
jgi:hypothetical protein